MKPVVLDDISCDLDVGALSEELRVRSESKHSERLLALIEKAHKIAKPKALYREVSYQTGEDRVIVDGVVLQSRLLVRNLEKDCRAYPFLATCGIELDDWAASKTGNLERFWANAVCGLALEIAIGNCIQHIQEHCHQESLSMMNPGSLEDWPLTEQSKVFTILVEPIGTIGVRLTNSSMMIPLKTVSGILFPSREGFVNCQYCPREDCPSRRAACESDHLS